MKNFFSNLFDFFFTPWWIKITTAEPKCIYYFGPFESEKEAVQYQAGFIEDLQQENAQQITASIQRSSAPDQLTIELEPSKSSAAMVSV
ncbi:MAG: hypothetical protein DCF25_03055 [Leptolyngbya foveolarum]|uniref:DUF1816 domain-containing protein n=1 Tax=Leptolyngbya foveolarum TaxID=47253 RepID=A0A2W4UQB0_9CYAN|nr:MAG: hypothetical protein DCF25_03055 [Leptolyngbya foveolarum]